MKRKLVRIAGTNPRALFPEECAAGGYVLLPSTTRVADIQPGDVIPFTTLCFIVEKIRVPTGDDRYFRMEGREITYSTGDVEHDEWSWFGDSLVEDACRPVAAVRQVKNSSPWNGKCPRCGSNTYMGLNSVEHESKTCR